MSWLSAVPPRGSRKRVLSFPFWRGPGQANSSGDVAMPFAGRFQFSMGDFDKVVDARYEVYALVTRSGAVYEIRNITDNVSISGSEITFGTAESGVVTMKRSSDIKDMLPGTLKTLAWRLDATTASCTMYTATLLVFQKE